MKLLPSTILFLLSAFAVTLNAGNPPADQCQNSITWHNRTEMFVKGAFHVKDVNGHDKGTFLLNYLPGAGNILHDAGHHWVNALETLRPFLHGEQFWHNKIWKGFTDGLHWGWDANAQCGFGAIPKDFKSLWADFNSVKVTEFGGLGHMALDCVGVVASLVCRPIIGVGALAAGAVAAIVVPAFRLGSPVCLSIGEATVCGAGWPVLKMVWNGAAWVATQVYTHTPPEANTIMVTWVPAKANDAQCAIPPKDDL